MKTMISGIAMAVALGLSMPAQAAKPRPKADPVAEADAFVAQADKELGDYSVLNARASWINANFITDDTDAIAAEFGARGTELGVKYAKGAAKFDGVKGLSFDTRRKLELLRLALVLPAPSTAGASSACSRSACSPSSRIGPSTAIRRSTSLSEPRLFNVAAIDAGLAL